MAHRLFGSDHAGSDDLEEVLELSRREAGGSGLTNGASAIASSSGRQNAVQGRDEGAVSYKQRQELNGRVQALDVEIRSVDADIQKLQTLRSTLLAEKQDAMKQLDAMRPGRISAAVNAQINNSSKGKGRMPDATNYLNDKFDWTGELKSRMKSVFGIGSFRLCQEGVCNANMDDRDVVCVMPTGGGKSLTYQLPALLNPGCTLVISPLISLITDQILHLRDAGVEAVMLTGSTSKEESREIFNRLVGPTKGKGRQSFPMDDHAKDIKLCYVTPEKIAKSKTFTSMLEKMASAGRLARIVIDEAHCVSQLGHDFRPDYKKLSILRQLFPHVPILALSATCPPDVLKDLVTTLRLKPVTDGKASNASGTIYFSAPLYRKNLHYTVLPKPAAANAVIQTMANYITEKHAEQSGIIYCLSKKDAETVATGVKDASGGKIRTGVYHADIHDRDKESLHKRWRKGEIKVVCATIAFGLGIDKGDVRFVLHHSMSKSLDGYYQESGRAGRDGQDSDCILYYRPQDAVRLSALVCGELEGQKKLYDMLRFAQDLEECRKLQFAKYFSVSSSLAISSWTTDEADALARCGHCDNCTRATGSVERNDVTIDAWKALRIAEAVEGEGGRVTLGMLGDLVRGAGGGAFGVSNGGRRKSKEKVSLDLEAIAGGKVGLSKDDTEAMLVHLMLANYLKESFHSTAYAINVEDLREGRGPRTILAFSTARAKKGASGKGDKRRPRTSSGGDKVTNGRITDYARTSTSTASRARKRKRKASVDADGSAGDENESDYEDGSFVVDDDVPVEMEEDDDDDGGGEWDFGFASQAEAKGGAKAREGKRIRPNNQVGRTHAVDDDDVIELSD